MAKWISKRERIEFVEYRLNFDRDGQERSGYSFPCNEQGEVHRHEMKPAGLENLRRCLEREIDDIDPDNAYVEKYEHSYYEPGEIECEDCHSPVVIHGFTNTCDCGADYNMSGQRLAPREQWGEETGEHWTECV